MDLELRGVLGKGTFAVVCMSKLDNQECAVKRLCKNAVSQAWIRMVIREITALRALSHPRIVRLLRVSEDEKCVYLALDCLKGGNLLTRLRQVRQYSELEARVLFSRLLEVVAYIHDQGYIHRDIKAENILLVRNDDQCEFKLADFGLATQVAGKLQEKCGSPGYVAPEILRRGFYGVEADLFSCGVLLYFLLSGQLPFQGSCLDEVLAKNRECRINFHAQQWTGVSRQAIELVLLLTNPNPLQRINTVQALQHAWFQDLSSSPAQFPERVGATLSSREQQFFVSGELIMRINRRTSDTSETSPTMERIHEGMTRSCRKRLAEQVRVEQCHSPGRVLRN